MKKFHVLIVDDDTYTLGLYNMILEWTPYKAFIRTEENANNAISILEKLQQSSSNHFPDYIILDLRMPEMHGYEFIREFERKFPQRKDKTYFIITTSSVLKEEEIEAACFNCIKDFLVKPIPRDYIERLVTEGYHPGLKQEV
jgi:response regulator RpfG family c-di-GMP phosphodiesterase